MNIEEIWSNFLLRLNFIVIRKQLTLIFAFTRIINHTTREFEEKIIFSRELLIKSRSGKTLKSVRKNINKKHLSETCVLDFPMKHSRLCTFTLIHRYIIFIQHKFSHHVAWDRIALNVE